jgi:hypothetical protein
MGDLEWIYESLPDFGIDHRFSTGTLNPIIKHVTTDDNNDILKCTCLRTHPAPVYGIALDNTISTYVLGGIYVNCTAYSDAASFKTAMTGQRIWFTLATPIVYHLTPTEVKLLAAKNNIWADTGDTSLTYEAHPKLYIEKLTAPTEDDMVDNNTIASGTYFMIGNKLYLSTTTIPAGDTINPGSNCTLTSLAEALNAIN